MNLPIEFVWSCQKGNVVEMHCSGTSWTMLRTLLSIRCCLLSVLAFAEIGFAQDTALSEADAESDWYWLFDGSNLDQWREFNKHGPVSPAWVVEDGVLAFLPERKTSTDPVGIITKEQFSDFELELEWKISAGGNSGIFFHVTEHQGLERPSRTGLEMQILDNDGHRDAAYPNRTAGAAYDLYAPDRDVTRPVGEWNQVRVVSIGDRVEFWLNGERTVEFDRDSEDWRQRFDQSKFGSPGFEHLGVARQGHIGLQDHADPVFFRNIRIRRH